MSKKLESEYYNPETDRWEKTRYIRTKPNRRIARVVAAHACPTCGAKQGQLCINQLFSLLSRTDETGKPRITPRSVKHGKSIRTTSRLPSRSTYRAYVHAARRSTPITTTSRTPRKQK